MKCSQCNRTWRGSVLHCALCHSEFEDARAFYAHQAYRSCRDPEQMERMSLTRNVWSLT
ncbi:hypothetical protein [Gordonia hongkongensis]|uniref:FDXHR family putative zinc-binding protein n=1 Tax=Gordonia hongkongensis TaxID=1701090 RepID=UPI003D713733